MWVNLVGSHYKQVSDLFVSHRPDMAFIKGNVVHILELTICHESNILSSKQYKLDKYKNLKDYKSNHIKNHEIKISTCEITVLGFVKVDLNILKFLGINKLDGSIVDNIITNVIRESFDIYVNRNVKD